MRKLYTLLSAIIITTSAFAQVPEKMSYQAVIRDASNNLVASSNVGMQFSILQGSTNGTAIYVETQTPTSNANGLVSLEIGNGTIVSGNFTTIDWTNGSYFVKTETDPTGGTSYTITGTSQLLSVPYALHSKTAESITGTVNYTETDPIYNAWDKSTGISITESQISNLTHTVDTDTHIDSTGIAALGYVAGSGSSSTSTDKFYLGKDTLGGIVFYIYKNSNGEQHGLIVNYSKSNIIDLRANNSGITEITNTYDGEFNTANFPNTVMYPSKQYVSGLGTGWYIPSIDELTLLGNNRFVVQEALILGGYTSISFNDYYWSSTIVSYPGGLGVYYRCGTRLGVTTAVDNASTFGIRVRAIKSF